MSEWRPILTAPMDGRCILVCRRGDQRCEIARYDRKRDCWVADFVGGGLESDLDHFRMIGENEPEFWMPLPIPP